MISLAHIINPFHADPGSELEIAQPITFESMRRAKHEAEGLMNISLLSAQFPEDRSAVPEGFLPTTNLTESTLDLKALPSSLKLPFIGDIVQRALNESTAEWIVYTNVDIGLMPEFYVRCRAIIKQGYDAFIINRRRIPARYTRPDQLPEIYKQMGKAHPGFDCFVVKRAVLEEFSLARIAIGVPFIGITMAQNVFALAEKSRVFDEEHLTFHLGMELFAKRASKQHVYYNRKEFWKALDPIYPQLDSNKWPGGHLRFLDRMITWGLHPSLPIRLALKLEPRRWRSYLRWLLK